MTIIRPSHQKTYLRFIALLVFLVVAGGGIYIYEYNTFVDTRHKLDTVKLSIFDTEKSVAQLKERLYGQIDPVKLKIFADDNNLVLERNPRYLTQNQ